MADEKTFQCGTGQMGTLYWSKDADLDKLPEMHLAEGESAVYRRNPDGSYTFISGGIDVGDQKPPQ